MSFIHAMQWCLPKLRRLNNNRALKLRCDRKLEHDSGTAVRTNFVGVVGSASMPFPCGAYIRIVSPKAINVCELVL